jgi:hypothetical protein
MTIGQKYLHINGITWHCLSIFYARKNIAVLLNAINDFCETNKTYLKHWSMYFSRELGERINLVFISENQNQEISALIEEYFERFLKENPSEDLHSIPYGFILWIPYSNNSLVWNAFHIPHFLFTSKEIRDFAQATSQLIVGLYDAESSCKENTTAIALFMFVKLWKKQGLILPETVDPEIVETLQSYWEYEEDDLLAVWMQYACRSIFVIYAQLDISKRNIAFLNF